MALDLDAFGRRYSCCHHLTSPDNVARLRTTRRLDSAAAILEAANEPAWLKRRRPNHLSVRVSGEVVCLRDQAPLNANNVTFEDGWTFDRLIYEINRRDLRYACRPLTLQFTRLNSGAAMSRTKNRRGSDTFLAAGAFKGTPSEVVEVVVQDGVALPTSTTVRFGKRGPWRPLFGDDPEVPVRKITDPS